MAKKLTTEDIKGQLQRRIEKSSLRKVALELEVSAAYLSDVMLGKRSVGKKLSAALGLTRQRTVTTAPGVVTVTTFYSRIGAGK